MYPNFKKFTLMDEEKRSVAMANTQEQIEALRTKFFNHCVDPQREDDIDSRPPINMYAEDVWQWILDNFIQKEEDKWISVAERLPENIKGVLGYDGKVTYVVQYTKGHELVIDIDDVDNHPFDPYEEKTGQYYLKEGWYEDCEQVRDEYDYIFVKRKITHWMSFPQPPKQ